MEELLAPEVGDAMGRNLLRYMRSGPENYPIVEVIERDDGLVGTMDVATYFADPSQWAEAERAAVERCVGRVLDVGVGAGRHALALSDRGHQVVGIDSSAGAVQVSVARGVAAVEVSFSDYVSRPGSSFDSVLMAGYNLGLLGGLDAGRAVLRRAAKRFERGTRIIGVTADPGATSSPVELAYQTRNYRRGRLIGQERIRVRSGRIATPWFDYTFFTPEDLVMVTEGTGWVLSAFDAVGKADAVVELVLS